jgi:ATP-dependent RNA helicase DDX24/MAK5
MYLQGSGKTLAYGLPILHHLLTSITCSKDSNFAKPVPITPPASGIRRPLQALILAPTRELALQVSEHLNACLEEVFFSQRTAVDEGKASQDIEVPKVKPTPAVSVAAIVGGMSAQKQRRILARGADVLVATPGRFWDLCGEVSILFSRQGELIGIYTMTRRIPN